MYNKRANIRLKALNIGELKIPIPIIQGGMGIGISLSGLASAVANEGGVGVIATVGIGALGKDIQDYSAKDNIEALRKEIRKARNLTSGVLGVNIMSVLTDFSDLVKTSVEEGIDIIFVGSALPLDLPKYLPENSKTKLVPIISSTRAAKIIANKWKQNFNRFPDAFVLEGPKAGGHLGFKYQDITKEEFKLENLLDDLLEMVHNIESEHGVKIPVITGGGIFSGEDIYKIIEKGASGVQMGTRFVATDECDASQEFKEMYINASSEDAIVIESPVGLPGRAIKNQFLLDAHEGKEKPKSCKYHCMKPCKPKETKYCIANALLSAYHGKFETGFAFSGANVGNVKKIVPVKELFQELINDYNKYKK